MGIQMSYTAVKYGEKIFKIHIRWHSRGNLVNNSNEWGGNQSMRLLYITL